MTPTIESKISHLLAERNKEAIELVFTHYGSLLLNIINRVLRDDEMSEDVLQSVLLKIWQNGHNFDSSKGSLFTWLVRVSKNAAIDKTRTKDYRLSQESKNGVEVVSIAESISTGDEIEKLYAKQLIAQLPGDQKVLINMSFFEGYSHKEICENLGIPLGTVKTRIRTAIKHLRSII
ncbi:RNA polymerase sigma factor [Roseivirga sp. E12]|uniref:RNA polymerase sigma factor n=1 Tax=Roseivirga sp. E12 TaxID=2819237 RepID=UPI001ABD0521|nr:sigma-70 family RNA polymerase sigma factor [Roseivirga sp. E12]MBO3697558.1 sigma-70 family RNA polymerase sigma factor [Roseivirga sp. E12]